MKSETIIKLQYLLSWAKERLYLECGTSPRYLTETWNQVIRKLEEEIKTESSIQ